MLRAELAAALERQRRLELRVAELECRLEQDSSSSGTSASREPIGPWSGARPGGGSGRNRSGNGAGTARAAGSPAIPERACPATQTRMSARAQKEYKRLRPRELRGVG